MKQCTAPVEGHASPDSAANCPQHGGVAAARATPATKSDGYPTSIEDLRAGDKVFVIAGATASGAQIRRESVLRRTSTMIVLDGGTKYRAADGQETSRDYPASLALITDKDAVAKYRARQRGAAMSKASLVLAGLSRLGTRMGDHGEPYEPGDLAEARETLELVRRALLVDAQMRPDTLTECHATPSGAPYRYTDEDVVAVLGPTTRIWKTLDTRLEAAGVTSAQREAIGAFCPASTRNQFENLLGSVDALADSEDVPPAAQEAAETASQELFGILARLQGYKAP